MSPSMQAVLMGAPDPLTPAVCKATRSREEFVVDADIAAFLSIHRGRVLNSAMTVRNGRSGYVVTLAVI